VPKGWYETFIDADIAQKYTYLSYVPKTQLLSLYTVDFISKHFYLKKNSEHTKNI
jgi:hypothetical protein